MSDYLSRLVARTFNPIEVIQPRLASLFEPPAPSRYVFEEQKPLEQLNEAEASDKIKTDTLRPFQPEPHDSTKNTLESRHIEANLLITNTPILDSRSAHLINRASVSKQVASQPDNSVLRSAHDQSQSDVVKPSSINAPVKDDHEKPTSTLATVSRDDSYSVPPQGTARKSRDAKPEQDIMPISVKLSTVKKDHNQLASTSNTTDKDESYTLQPQGTAGENKPELGIMPISITRISSPVDTISQATSQIFHSGLAKIATEPPEPAIIHVTIGSIEVRAITTPVQNPQQRTRLSKPRLSLDDYMRSRNGGKL